MKVLSINGTLRSKKGKKEAKLIRREEKVPCVLYGGTEQVTFSVIEKDFKPLVYTPEIHTVKLNLEGKEFNAILQDIQYHPLNDKIIHADFLQLIPGKAVTMNVPVQTTGVSPGVKAGGKLQKKMRTVKVKGMIEKMPDSIKLDITPLEIGDSIRVGDLKSDGMTFLQAPNITVVGVRITRNVVEETPAAGATTAAAGKAPAAGAPAAAGAAAPAAAAAGAKAPAAKAPAAKK
jgi:large subunit ribosomal protein L25